MSQRSGRREQQINMWRWRAHPRAGHRAHTRPTARSVASRHQEQKERFHFKRLEAQAHTAPPVGHRRGGRQRGGRRPAGAHPEWRAPTSRTRTPPPPARHAPTGHTHIPSIGASAGIAAPRAKNAGARRHRAGGHRREWRQNHHSHAPRTHPRAAPPRSPRQRAPASNRTHAHMMLQHGPGTNSTAKRSGGAQRVGARKARASPIRMHRWATCQRLTRDFFPPTHQVALPWRLDERGEQAVLHNPNRWFCRFPK